MLDTNIVSYLVRDRHPGLRERLLSLPTRTRPCVSVLTEAELLFGAVRKAPAPNLEEGLRIVMAQLDILPWTSAAARTYATLRSSTERSGLTVATIDLLIAAHALAAGCTLVTNDVTLLRLSPTLPVENWV